MDVDGEADVTTVRVRLRLDGAGRTLPHVVVAVEDVSRADAPARRVGQTVLRDVVVPAEGLDVEVPVAQGPDPARLFVVRARGGADADARTFAPDDLLSAAAPVVLDGGDDVEVTLRPVR